MRQSTIIRGAAAIVTVLALLTGVAMWMNISAVGKVKQAISQKDHALADAAAIKASSALLTNMVRAYTATGDVKWLNEYWKEINETQSQAKAIADLKKQNAPASELALLSKAKDLSAALVTIETRAQRLVLEGKGTPEAQMPEAVAGFKLSAEDAALSNDQKLALASDLTHNEIYQGEVTKIMTPIAAFNSKLRTRVDGAVHDARGDQTFSLWLLGIAIMLIVGALGGVLYLFNSKISQVIERYTNALHARDPKDLSFRLETEGTVETRQLGEAFNELTQQVSDVITMIRDNAQTLAKDTDALIITAREMSESSEESARESTVAQEGASQVSTNLGSVAAATEEMSASIRQIADSAVNASSVAGEAVRAAEAASNTVDQLSESSSRIGEVMKAITSIAEQTNLLALNATIEAARAGEAGKGFAVVASEVKELARQTALATEDISNRVASIQADAGETAVALEGISEIIQRIDETQATIASAVEEQTATTNEMSRTIGVAAGGASEIAHNTERVNGAASRTSSGVLDTMGAAENMACTARSLSDLVSSYRS